MGSDTVLLVKLLSDLAITVMQTIARVDQMTEEEVDRAIEAAEETGRLLKSRLDSH